MSVASSFISKASSHQPKERLPSYLLSLRSAVRVSQRGEHDFWIVSDPSAMRSLAADGYLAETPLATGLDLLVNPLLVLALEGDEMQGALLIASENVKGRAKVAALSCGETAFEPVESKLPTASVRAVWVRNIARNRGIAFGLFRDACFWLDLAPEKFAWAFGIERAGCPPEFAPETFDLLKEHRLASVLIA